MMKIKLSILLFMLLLLIACGKQPDKKTTEEKTVTIACWIKDYPLSYCVEEFNNRNKEYQIEIYEYYDEAEQNYTTAMTRMQLDLITNDSWDLLYLDSMNIYELENAGLLMDILPLIEQDPSFKKEDYYWDIWEQYKRNEQLYEWIPAFELTGVIGPSELLSNIDTWTIDEYLEFSRSTGQKIGHIKPETMLGYMLQYTSSNMVDLKNRICQLDSEEFQSWLNYASGFEPENGCFWVHWVRGINDYLSWQFMYNTPVCLVNIPTTQTTGVCASAHFSFGISSKTENVSACWEFLKFLMDDEVLNATTLGTESVGFPMKKSLMVEQLILAQLPESEPESLLHLWGEDAIPMTEADALRLESQIKTVSCVEARFSAVVNIVSDEAQAFFNGDKSVEETTKIIQNRVSIYLSEQQ